MKKIFLLMVLLMLAGPALAAVTVTADCTYGDVNECAIRYAATGNDVRAFALDITVDNDAKIISVGDGSSDYYVNPGSVEVDDQGNISGSLVCDGEKYDGTLGGICTGGITTEQGSLYVGDANSPGGAGTGSSGVLFSFKVDIDCNVTVVVNSIRGGVVMENPDEDPDLTIVDGCHLAPLPACWACPFWAKGDLDGDGYVTGGDVIPILNFFGQSTDNNNICADVDKDGFITGGDVIPILNNFGAGDGVACPVDPCP